MNELPAAEVLVLLDVVRLEPDAVEVVPQLTLVALHPVDLNTHVLISKHVMSREERRYIPFTWPFVLLEIILWHATNKIIPKLMCNTPKEGFFCSWIN